MRNQPHIALIEENVCAAATAWLRRVKDFDDMMNVVVVAACVHMRCVARGSVARLDHRVVIASYITSLPPRAAMRVHLRKMSKKNKLKSATQMRVLFNFPFTTKRARSVAKTYIHLCIADLKRVRSLAYVKLF